MIYERTFIRFFRECLAQVDSKIPLQERVFFVGISASNLMESLTTRYPMAVKELKHGDLESYQRDIGEFYAQIVKTWNKFNQRYELIKPVDELKKGAGEWVRKTFKKDVFPALQPMTVDKGKDLNLRPGLYLIVTTEDTKKDRRMINYIEIPKKLPRHIVVDDKHFAVDVVDLIQNNLEFMFKDRRIVSSYPIIINRSAEIQLSQLSDLDPLDQVRATLKEREKSWITTLEVGTTDKKELKRLKNLINISSDTVILASKHDIGLAALKDIPSEVFRDKDRSRRARIYKTWPKDDLFAHIKKQDRLAAHPYESYQHSFVRFLELASTDPDVVSIKISLYRVSDNSKIINALLTAADKGKSVTVLIELKARFDEQHNIEIANLLESGGVRVAFTDPNMKTHAKLCLVTRREKKGLVTYCQVGTGNYSETNSKQYTDYSYFTANKDMAYDLTRFFDLLTSNQGTFKSRKVVYAPYNMRETIDEEIDTEIKKARAGKVARIVIKCNGLTDESLAKHLEKAADSGVRVQLIIRGACIIGSRRNLTVKSIVGFHLEHSRIYQFGKGDRARIYIGSADAMRRNLSMRHELLILVEQKDIRERLMKHLEWYLDDNQLSWKILKDYGLERIEPKDGEKKINVQEKMAQEAKEEN